MKDFIKKNGIMIISLILFCILTIPKLLHHFPWFDEAHAWILAQDMTFYNFIDIIRKEGHFILWYLALMPFAKLNLGYPYSMLFLNWCFYFLAIFILWKKAPFNNVIKIIITFAWISLNYFSIVARCYSLGILGLFILCSLYKKQYEKPILYSIIMVLVAHTTLMNALTVVPFGFIYLYNLIKNKAQLTKKHTISIIILLTGAILWIYPFIHGYGDKVVLANNSADIKAFFFFFIIPNILLGIMYLTVWILTFVCADNKIRFWLSAVTIEYILFYSFIYRASPHLMIYTFIYLIAALWLTPKLCKISIPSVIYTFFLAGLMFTNLNYHLNYILHSFDKRDLIKYLNNMPIQQYIYISWHNQDMLPLLNKNYKIVSIGDEKEIDCLNNYTCAENYIFNDLKGKEHWTAYLISIEKLNSNSVEFENTQKHSFPPALYVTTFSK